MHIHLIRIMLNYKDKTMFLRLAVGSLSLLGLLVIGPFV